MRSDGTMLLITAASVACIRVLVVAWMTASTTAEYRAIYNYSGSYVELNILAVVIAIAGITILIRDWRS